MMTATLMPHEAHATLIQSTFTIDGKPTLNGYLTWCEDCPWSESFLSSRYPSMLTAWNEAARARDIHHDTHHKEIAHED